ncbi:MAG: class II fructose-1,6-bisphosphate aldolase [Anaerolineae bacterium]|nr:class II fructose-1,6-bisphosphate aldolase [Anaerolineae bacterium]MDW8101710.1 class II fructose-1,6-bisphosphate aldolase [Anaerolineae bacterium]
MPLVTSKELLRRAFEEHYAIGAFNANNMEQIQAIVEAAQEERAPVILQVSQGAIRYAGLEMAAGMVKIAASQVDVPVVLHLDHGTSFEQNILCLRAGFTSLMFDGSKLPFEENVAITRKVCEVAHAVGIPVEAELGQVLQITDKVTLEDVERAMTDPDQAAEFIRLTGADSLAVAIGSIHAMREQEATLDIERLKAIRKKVNIPLVLHGSSGVKDESILEAIENGISKINVATYLNQAFVRGLREGIEKMPDEVDPRKFLAISREYVKEAVREKIRLFGSAGRIDSTGGFVSPRRVFAAVKVEGIE